MVRLNLKSLRLWRFITLENERTRRRHFEVGLGGRLDSTNVIYPLLSVITNVGYDHIHILGNTLEQIAFEKREL